MLYTSPLLSRHPHIVHGWSGVPPNAPRHFKSLEDANAQRSHHLSHALKIMNMENTRPVLLNQNHGKSVHNVTHDFLCNYIPEKIQGDGLVTKQPSIALGVRTADCGPVLWAEPEAGIIAACHAGWRGAVGGILHETHKAICALGGDSDKIIAVLGPTISGNSYSVNEDFRDVCRQQAPNSESFFSTQEGQLFFDLPQFILHELRQMDIKNVGFLPHNTFSGPFYSRRASFGCGGVYGSNYAFISLFP